MACLLKSNRSIHSHSVWCCLSYCRPSQPLPLVVFNVKNKSVLWSLQRHENIVPSCLVPLSTFTYSPEEGAEFYPFHWWRWQRLQPHKASGIRQNPTTTYYCHQDHNHHPASLPSHVVILTEIWVSKEKLPRAKYWSLDKSRQHNLTESSYDGWTRIFSLLEVVSILRRPSCPFPQAPANLTSFISPDSCQKHFLPLLEHNWSSSAVVATDERWHHFSKFDSHVAKFISFDTHIVVPNIVQPTADTRVGVLRPCYPERVWWTR